MKKLIILLAIVVVGVGLIAFTANKPAVNSPKNSKQVVKNHDASVPFYMQAMDSMNKRDYKAALENFDKTIELDPTFVAAYVNRGMLRQRIQDLQGAHDDFAMAVKLSPTNKMAIKKKGYIEKLPEFSNKSKLKSMKEAGQKRLAEGKIK